MPATADPPSSTLACASSLPCSATSNRWHNRRGEGKVESFPPGYPASLEFHPHAAVPEGPVDPERAAAARIHLTGHEAIRQGEDRVGGRGLNLVGAGIKNIAPTQRQLVAIHERVVE